MRSVTTKQSSFFKLPPELIETICKSATIKELLAWRKTSATHNYVATCEIFSRRTAEAIACQKRLMSQWVEDVAMHVFTHQYHQRSNHWLKLLQQLYFDPQIDFTHRQLTLRFWELCSQDDSANTNQAHGFAFLAQLHQTLIACNESHDARNYESILHVLNQLVPHVRLSADIKQQVEKIFVYLGLQAYIPSRIISQALQLIPIPDADLSSFSARLIANINTTYSFVIAQSCSHTLNCLMEQHPEEISTIQTQLESFFKENLFFRFDVLSELKTQYVKREWLINASIVFLRKCHQVQLAKMVNDYFAMHKHGALLGECHLNYFYEVVLNKINFLGANESFISLDLPKDTDDRRIQAIMCAVAHALLRQMNAFFDRDSIGAVDCLMLSNRLSALAPIAEKLNVPSLKRVITLAMVNSFDRYLPRQNDNAINITSSRIIFAALLSAFPLLDEASKTTFKEAIERKLASEDMRNFTLKIGIIEALIKITHVHMVEKLGLLKIDVALLMRQAQLSGVDNAKEFTRCFAIWHQLQTALIQETHDENLVMRCFSITQDMLGAEGIVYLSLLCLERLYLQRHVLFSDNCIQAVIKTLLHHELAVRQKALNLFTMLFFDLSDKQKHEIIQVDSHSFELCQLKAFILEPHHVVRQELYERPNSTDVGVLSLSC